MYSRGARGGVLGVFHIVIHGTQLQFRLGRAEDKGSGWLGNAKVAGLCNNGTVYTKTCTIAEEKIYEKSVLNMYGGWDRCQCVWYL